MAVVLAYSIKETIATLFHHCKREKPQNLRAPRITL